METAVETAQRRSIQRIRQSAGRQASHAHQEALKYDPQHFVCRTGIGEMDKVCLCGAHKFVGETPSMCCSAQQVCLDFFPPLPNYLADLYYSDTPDSRHFLASLRKYNCAFQMTSFGCNEVHLPGWNPSFRVQGQVFHRIGSLLPQPDQPPQFLQVYYIDNHCEETNTRMNITTGLKEHIVTNLCKMLHQCNQSVQLLKTAKELLERDDLHACQVVINEERRPPGDHARRFNVPISDEIGILMPNELTHNRDIVLQYRDGQLQHVSELHRSYDALQYPLLFPHGTDGYHINLRRRNGKKVTQMAYYAFHIMVRDTNHLLRARRLFQQFLVDAYCKIETERLMFIRREQKKLRADSYLGLRDSLLPSDADPRNAGQRVILPSTFTGGPRYMHERQMDAMTYVRTYGKPDLFITMTTNPRWPEITDNLFQGQVPQDRPDLLARVFRLKLKKLMDFLKRGVFGEMLAWLYSIEFQKRGLPHVHILVWLVLRDRVHPNMIDKVISAEIPSSSLDPELHAIVKAHMVHGPCGALNKSSPCMKDGKCSKKFPKEFVKFTEQGQDGYPRYQRRSPADGGHIAKIKMQQVEQAVDNQWIVPYNPWLLRQMNCHVNVELCMSIKSIKYVLKYVNKGCDQAVYTIQPIEQQQNADEIKKFQQARFVGSCEAA